ncbi:GAF domain-containing protein [Brevundimonas sp.]|uniref:GAF domain-containing protein n=1 Tax=Brevundimonas sp. TaxID=1871086 RepID=UPI002FC59FD3
MFIKLVLIVGGSAVAGAAQFMAIPAGEEISTWGIAGVAAVILAGCGGLYMAFVDQDASHELALAAQAIEQAREFEEALSESVQLFEGDATSLSRAIELYLATNALGAGVERMIGVALSDTELAERLLGVADRSLLLALDFNLMEHWTLTIYKTEQAVSGRRQLRALAFKRSMPCKVEEARVLPEGIGVAGICLAKNEEVIVPDMAESRTGNMHELGSIGLPHDAQRYRSLAAAPIRIAGQAEPWGVICATSDRPGHFSPDGKPGVRTDEAIRALAGMVALAVAAQHIQRGESGLAAAKADVNKG